MFACQLICFQGLWGLTVSGVNQYRQRLCDDYGRVTKHLAAAAAKNKRLYDHTAHDAPLLPGERVLVRDSRLQGKGKLSHRWEARPYVVVSCQGPDMPVYKICPEGQPGPERVLHWNLLRPCPNYPTTNTALMEEPEAPRQPLMGWALVPGGLGQRDAEPPPPSRRSQRANQGQTPERYGNWTSQ